MIQTICVPRSQGASEIYILFFFRFSQSVHTPANVDWKTFPIYFVCNFCCLAINLFCKLFGRIHILSRTPPSLPPIPLHSRCERSFSTDDRRSLWNVSHHAQKNHLVYHSITKRFVLLLLMKKTNVPSAQRHGSTCDLWWCAMPDACVENHRGKNALIRFRCYR